jgi:hypothetical protein
VGRDFTCRRCLGLTYARQRVSAKDYDLVRVAGKARAIRTRLGGGGGLLDPFPSRPKGMHNKTYERLWDEYVQTLVSLGRITSTRMQLSNAKAMANLEKEQAKMVRLFLRRRIREF